MYELEHKSAQKMIRPLSYIYYNNASRIYKIYHFLMLLSFVCMCVYLASFALSSISLSEIRSQLDIQLIHIHTCIYKKDAQRRYIVLLAV